MPSDSPEPTVTPPEEIGAGQRRADHNAARNAADRKRHAETKDPFTAASYGPMPYVTAEGEREITAERNATHDLSYLGKSIQENWDRAEKSEDRAVDMRVTAARNLVAAEIECKAAGLPFINWAVKTLHREKRAIYTLLKIGKSPDPRAELMAIRDEGRMRMAKHRVSHRLEGPPAQTRPPPVQQTRPPRIEAGQETIAVEQPAPTEEDDTVDRLDIGPVLKEMPLWHMDQLMAVAAKLVPMLDTDSRRNLVVTTGTDLGLELTRAKGPRFRATLASVMEDFGRLSKHDQMEFLRRIERQSAA